MKFYIIFFLALCLTSCSKSKISGNSGACKSVYDLNNNSVVINDSLLSPFCIIDGINYKIDLTDYNLFSIEWNTGDSTSIIALSEPGNYEGFGINNSNDTIYFSFLAQNCDDHVYIPNTLSPNGDGLNDIWKPIYSSSTICQEEYRIKIFNTYHQLIFSSNDPNSSWDGTIKGESALEGVYHYLLKYKREDGENFGKSGQLLLIR